jgi:tetratricopeptide (TPR) repeat protein
MEKTKKLFFLLILFYNTELLSAQYAAIFKLPFPQQYHALDSVIDILANKDTLHAQNIIMQMQAAAGQTHNEQTILNFERSKVNYDFIVSRDTTDTLRLNELVNKAQKLLNTVDEAKYPEIAAMLNVYLANTYYLKLSKYSMAFEHYLNAYDLFRNISVKTFPDRHYSQYQIAMAYYEFNDYPNAIKLGTEIESLYQTKDYISLFTVQMIGVSYVKLKMYDSALICYKWVFKNGDLSSNPVAWEGIAMGSIGDVYFYTNRFDKAVPYLDSGITYALQADIPDNTADFASNLSTIYLEQGKLQLEKKYVDIAHVALQQSYTPLHTVQGFRWLSNCNTVYHALSAYYKATHNLDMALMYSDSAGFYKDSLNRRHDVTLKYQGEILVEKEKTAQSEALLEQQISKQKVIRNSLIIVIGLVMFITLLLYNRSKLKTKYREEQLLAEKQLAEAELKNARQRLNEFTKSIFEKNELIEEIKAEISQLQLKQQQGIAASALPAITDDSLKKLQESVLLTDGDWRNFTYLFDTVHIGFLTRLKAKLPGLSPAETRFLALSKLKLNNKEMATMLGVSTDAIRQTRSRLRKKLNLTDENGLGEELEKI